MTNTIPFEANHSGAQACFTLSLPDTATHGSDRLAQDVQELLLSSVHTRFPSLGCEATTGISSYQGDGVCARTASDVEHGFFAIEVIDLRSRDRWDAFIVRLPDGTHRTGWTRHCAGEVTEPSEWLEAVAHFKLGEEVQPQIQPSFLSLVAVFCSDTQIAVASSDLPERQAMAAEIDDLKQITALQAMQLHAMRVRLANAPASVEQEQVKTVYTGYDQVGAWAAENADRIIILPRAISACKNAQYDNPELLFQALELLATTYREVRTSTLPREQLIQRATELGLSIGGSVDPARATEDYFFRWGRRRRFLDQHLGRGNSRDPRHCLRVYFTWDQDTQMVICGSMPIHLPNSMT
ncbi:hypothetical protein [Hydrogenophaga sp. 2FB]|uniref:hypothetical protein n=1 Tax=Hydrogenophaga sp. 2FB TaxID=2502187 RepID=UPI0010F6F473|nr:hypothetical protein [Hydrogenophaga sp. 2FB]